MPKSKDPGPNLAQHLADADLDRARTKGVLFGVNASGNVRCFDRVTNVVGLGRSPLQAFLDWESKTTSIGKGTS